MLNATGVTVTEMTGPGPEGTETGRRLRIMMSPETDNNDKTSEGPALH